MAPRFFRHGELHLVILALVSTLPQHGYDLMAALGRLFGPRYRPSPGSVYPAVEALATEGLLSASEADGRRVYSITPSGAAALAARQDALTALEARTGVRLGHQSDVDAALSHFSARVRSMSPGLDPDTLNQLLDTAADAIEAAATSTPPWEDQ